MQLRVAQSYLSYYNGARYVVYLIYGSRNDLDELELADMNLGWVLPSLTFP